MRDDEYRAWRQKQKNLPLEELIAKPNCDFDCPEDKAFGCGCEFCWTHKGYYKPDEIKTRFTDEDAKEIEGLLKKGTGYLTDDGCSLERSLRSEACLRHICNKLMKITIVKG